jgi:serine/threonine protein kinase
MAILPSRFLGPHEILSPFGAGGIGNGYKHYDAQLDRFAPIKALSMYFADRAELSARFEREAITIASLNYPHICVFYAAGHHYGIDDFVMKCLEGRPLAHQIVKSFMPLAQVLQYAIELSDAIINGRRKGVIHRDLKPGNIMPTNLEK